MKCLGSASKNIRFFFLLRINPVMMRDKFSIYVRKINKLYSIICQFTKDDNVKKIRFPDDGTPGCK